MENIKFDDLDEKDDDFDIEEKLKNFENSDSNSNKNDNLNIISEIDFKIKLDNIQNLIFSLSLIYNNKYKYNIDINYENFQLYLNNLKNLKYTFLPINKISFISNKILSNNEELINIFSKIFLYLSSRYDILSESITKSFLCLNKWEYYNELENKINNYLIKKDYSFSINLDNDKLKITDYIYDNELGILIINIINKNSILNLIENLFKKNNDINCMIIFQKVMENNKVNFIKKLIKNFDIKINKIYYHSNKKNIIISFENGYIQIFYIKKVNEEYNIIESNSINILNNKITSMIFYNNYCIINNIINQIIILTFNNNEYNIMLNISLKDKMNGKGFITNLKLYEKFLILFSNTNLILFYLIDIKNNNSINLKYLNQLILAEKIFCCDLFKNNLIIGYKNKITIIKNFEKFDNEKENIILKINGEINEYVDIGIQNQINCICYINEINIYIIGLNTGSVLLINNFNEIIYAKKISNYSLFKICFEIYKNNNLLYIGDINGNIYFFYI